jgi:hypothetical protein
MACINNSKFAFSPALRGRYRAGPMGIGNGTTVIGYVRVSIHSVSSKLEEREALVMGHPLTQSRLYSTRYVRLKNRYSYLVEKNNDRKI